MVIELETIGQKEYTMVSSTLIRTEGDLQDLYKWLIFRTHEEEQNNNHNYARCYRELAEGVKKIYYRGTFQMGLV